MHEPYIQPQHLQVAHTLQHTCVNYFINDDVMMGHVCGALLLAVLVVQ